MRAGAGSSLPRVPWLLPPLLWARSRVWRGSFYVAGPRLSRANTAPPRTRSRPTLALANHPTRSQRGAMLRTALSRPGLISVVFSYASTLVRILARIVVKSRVTQVTATREFWLVVDKSRLRELTCENGRTKSAGLRNRLFSSTDKPVVAWVSMVRDTPNTWPRLSRSG